MHEWIHLLQDSRKLIEYSRQISLEILEDILQKFSVIVEERRDENVAIQGEHQQKIEHYRQLLLADNIDPSEIIQNPTSLNHLDSNIPTKKAPRPPRYEYYTPEGELRRWTGQGRTPIIIQRGIDQGRTLESFLIKTDK